MWVGACGWVRVGGCVGGLVCSTLGDAQYTGGYHYCLSGRQSTFNRDIPRQQEEYEVIYGTTWNAECHITSILRAGVEYLFYLMTNPHYLFVT